MVREIGRDRYEVVEGFFKRPKGWTFVEVADVSVDADDNVYVFNRGNHPVMIFDRDGNFLDAWGEIDGQHYFTFPMGSPSASMATCTPPTAVTRRSESGRTTAGIC